VRVNFTLKIDHFLSVLSCTKMSFLDKWLAGACSAASLPASNNRGGLNISQFQQGTSLTNYLIFVDFNLISFYHC